MMRGTAPMQCWLPEPLSPAVAAALERVLRSPDVVRLAVMPDVHLARDVCVGVALATRSRIYPAAVGGDIGCGMAALRLPGAGAAVDDRAAAVILSGLRSLVPIMLHPGDRRVDWPDGLDPDGLSTSALRRLARQQGIRQLGTLGRGNHFLELQRAGDDLWITVHSGSRGLGPAIRDTHLRTAPRDASGLGWLAVETAAGEAYRADVRWARRFARESRRRMLTAAVAVVVHAVGGEPDGGYINCDHNHVQREDHGDGPVWVHRKGAMAARPDAVGIVPGSMGDPTWHVVGRTGDEAARALGSCSHGAGRAMSRTEARRRITARRLLRRMRGVYFDRERAAALVEEAPAAYKDISAVMRAQSRLVRVVRRLDPVLSYKGT